MGIYGSHALLEIVIVMIMQYQYSPHQYVEVLSNKNIPQNN